MFLIFLPAVTIHEVMHAIGAVLTGRKLVSFRVFPRVERDGSITFGSVTSYGGIPFSGFVSAIFPIFLWPISAWLVLKWNIMDYSNLQHLDVSKKIMEYYTVIQLFMGGFLSRQDIAVALESIKNGIVFLAVVSFLGVFLWIFFIH